MVQWLALFPNIKKVLGLNLWNLHVLPRSVWVLSGHSDFLPQNKDMHVRLIGNSKFPVGVNAGPFDGLMTCPGFTPIRAL